MRPIRLFAILVFLTVSALAVVYLRAANWRTSYRIQNLHARLWELRRQALQQRAHIAHLSAPQRIHDELEKSQGPGPTPSPATPSPEPARDWEND